MPTTPDVPGCIILAGVDIGKSQIPLLATYLKPKVIVVVVSIEVDLSIKTIFILQMRCSRL